MDTGCNSMRDKNARVVPDENPTVHAFEYEEAARPDSPQHARAWRLIYKYPRFHKLLEYLQGPRPRRNLEDPVPFLTLTFYTGQRARTIPLEPSWIRLTRPFTAPWLFVLLSITYIIGLAFFSREQSFLVPADSFFGCTSTYWLANDQCGLDGIDCLPISYSKFDFRCPAQCTDTILQNPRTVGDEQVVYKPLIVGGGDSNRTYRGDSFICSSAVHAGVISNSKGGCATVQLVANHTNFLPSTANGLSSIGFPTVFPIGYQFLDTTSLRHCTDHRTPALVMNSIITAFLFLLFRPKPIVLFWSLVCIGYWHVVLFSQPGYPPDLSVAFGTFLPALLIAYALWRSAFRYVLPAFIIMPIEATVLYLLPFWVGVLNNLTLDQLPIDRLLASDINSRPGALVTLIVAVIILLIIIVNQVRVIRKTGWLSYYLFWYIAGGLIVLVLSQLPGLTLRLHHYFVAMILLPVTAFPTRLSAVYQGLLLGLFLNGGAAFGFDSIAQTGAELQRDAALGSALPSFLTNATNYNSSIPLQNQTISWASLPEGWDGFVLLVDDVERYVGPALNYSLSWLQPNLTHFLRIAFTSDGTTGDFTKAVSISPNGSWVDAPPGPS